MIGRVSFFDSRKRFALLTPIGRDRDYDIVAALAWFLVADIEVYVGQIVQFNVSVNREGGLEATDLQIPKATSSQQGISDGHVDAEMSGAATPAVSGGLEAAGDHLKEL